MKRTASLSNIASARRGGAVIIVVLALLSLMLFLGVFFFEFAQEEQQTSDAFIGANPDEVVNPEPIFSEALEQLLIGPRPSRQSSVLANNDEANGAPYGNVHSMLAHVLGPIEAGGATVGTKYGKPRDVIPHNGAGITTLYDASGYIQFDHNGDGVPDSMLDPADPAGLPTFAINFSPMAQPEPTLDGFNQSVAANRIVPILPDTDYTAPDLNHLYLAHDEIVNGRRVLVPSFFRPVLFPSRRDSDGNGANAGGGAGGFADIYTNAATRRLVMRPHSLNTYSDGTPRYLSASTTAQSGDTSRLIGPMPFSNDTNGNGLHNELGIYSNPSLLTDSNNYELDVDVNGDGQPDGIWMDLGFDLVDLPDGRQYVPLVSFMILDADSLGNLNVHSNLEGYFTEGNTYNSGGSFSVSNQGLGPNAVNLVRILNGDPTTFGGSAADLQRAQSEYAFLFGFASNTAQSALSMGNMDLLFLLSGRRMVNNGTSLGSPVAGRYGEEYQLLSNIFPRPGVTNQDDDNDGNNLSKTFDGGQARLETLYDPKDGSSVNVNIPPFVHPIALSETGAGTITTATGEQRPLTAPIAGNPSAWPTYPAFYDDPSVGYPVPSAGYPHVTPYSQTAFGATLLPNGHDGRLDEDNEHIASHHQRDRVSDNLFDPAEMLYLHASDADYQRANGRSRLDQLAPFNMRSARNSATTRGNLTTDSWDLNELTYVNFRAGESSVWTTSSGSYFTIPLTPGSKEFFPPLFGTLPLESAPGVPHPFDPIRPDVRRLLATEVSVSSYNDTNIGAGRTQLRQRLNLNRLLVGFDTSGNPIYRNLVPHPDIVTLENQDTGGTMPAITIPPMIHDHNAPIPAGVTLANITTAPADDNARATSATAQEWWARYDRQRMARDIYTLLYLTGATNNDAPATSAYGSYPNRESASGTVNSIPDNVEEMAQFAVNYVDALDRDDVITTFAYDPNLSDGWNSNPSDEVYGVEAQTLTFSEVMLIQLQRAASLGTGPDLLQTLHREDADTHRLLHIELRNASPYVVHLDEGWRIMRVPSNTARPDKWYSFKTNGFGSGLPADVKSVNGGENFHIACHDGTLKNQAGATIVTSDLYANIDGDADLESILPASTRTLTDNMVPATAYAPQADIDLAAIGTGEVHENYVNVGANGPTYPTGTLVDPLPAADAANTSFDLVLQRRQNLRGIAAGGAAAGPARDVDSESTGRWIEVDRFSVNSSRYGTGEGKFEPASDTDTDVVTALTGLNSRERPQPFVATQVSHSGTGYQNHSFSVAATTNKHRANSALIGTPVFTIWQPHFDRDFTSAYDLLSIPLFGNYPTGDIELNYADTYYPDVHGGAVVNLAHGDTTVLGGASLAGDYTAGVRFLFPNGIPAKPYFGWNPVAYANDWHRLFEFVQVPRRTEQSIQSQYPNTVAGAFKHLLRTPGLINLNTVRNETVLAALLDDNLHFPAVPTGSGLGYYSTQDDLSAGRNWYTELKQSRDGVDFFMYNASPSLANVTIPGTLSPVTLGMPATTYVARPFRSPSHVDLAASTTQDNAIENTVLRSRPNYLRPDNAGALTPPDMVTMASGSSPWSVTSMTTPTFPTNDWQGLLDARDVNNHQIDYSSRNRLLAKVANNTTTKSHVFMVWTAVGYFEAHRLAGAPADRSVQIGARITDLPVHRSFSVIDMSRLEDAYDSYSQTFDYSKFVIQRKRLR